ncbi:hypothetical protein BH09BAC5_BH09BAC5_04600 [soil metagenome]
MIKNKLKLFSLIAVLMLMTEIAQAQESTNAAGGDASGSGGTVAYSVGQIIYTTNSGATGTSAQGVQQPYEIYTTGIDQSFQSISVIVFPNPTSETLTLQVNDFNNLQYEMFDAEGKLILSNNINATKSEIEMKNLATGTYFINVNKENKKVQSFKIIKN